jgi:hypothetical protein
MLVPMASPPPAGTWLLVRTRTVGLSGQGSGPGEIL